MSLSCNECNRAFTLKSNLTRHLRMVHNLDVERIDILPASFDVYHYKCLEGCNISFRYNRELRKHLQSKHDFNLAELNLDFPNAEEFNKWLLNEQNTSYVQYVHLTATKRRSTGTETFYYECSRTGKRCYVDENSRKRKARKWVTKLNRGCTSQIIANKSFDGSYSVIYFKAHYGHEIGLEHLKLSKKDRGSVASKLFLGLPISTVLHSVKNPTGTPLKRINLLGRKDVCNIRKSFNIDLCDGKLVNIDAINISLFLSECASHQHNPILYSNVQDLPKTGDICLIIMTKYQSDVLKESNDDIFVLVSTTLNNCDFDLITLFTINKSCECFPTTFMFTNKTDYATYELFFSTIQQSVGNVVPSVFISNCNEMYYQAWRTVMGDVNHYYYNPFQVDIDWKLNLNRIFCSETDVTKVKRKWVYDTLKTLQNNRDETDFLENLEATLKVLSMDEDFAEFLQYFMENYNDPKKWAECYKIHCKLPSKQISALTDVLRQYLNEENEMRFDKIFHSLIRFIRDETINSMLKTKTNRAFFICENDLRHQTLISKQLNGIHLTDNLWNVRDVDLGVSYVVQKFLNKKCCNLTCPVCHIICLHSFSCSCVDFFVSNVICVHIHYIWITYFQSIIQEDCEDEEEQNCDEEIIIEVDEEQETSGKGDSLEFLRKEILTRTAVLSEHVDSVQSESRLKVILDTVTQLCELVVTKDEYHVKENVNNEFIDDHSYL